MSEFSSSLEASPLSNVRFNYQPAMQSSDLEEIVQGLCQKHKQIHPKYFYDHLGSQLFERITETPEYYPTRTERRILLENAESIAKYCGEDCVVIEPGSGSSEKIRLLLETMRPKAYVPMDISAEFLHHAAIRLGHDFPWLHVSAVCADFASYEPAQRQLPAGKRVVFYPGSTLGNMSREAARGFLRKMAGWLDSEGGVLVGIDLHKSSATLNAAYNDAEGLTAQFNLNVLNHLNRISDANFEPEQFEHLAFYNESERRIEMHLVSRSDQIVRVGGHAIALSQGERIHTENSHKYTLSGFAELAEQAGLKTVRVWQDQDALFSLHYLERIQ